MESVMGLVKTELFSVNTLQRNLVWFRNIIWPDELQKNKIPTCVIVSSEDHIVPSKEIIRSINQHNDENPNDSYIEVHEIKGSDHGGIVFEESYRERAALIIQNSIQNY
jgi:ABC-type antimicrobial peptide transport system permease subunit